MKAALLSERGVVKVAGDAARTFLDGLVTTDIDKVAPGRPRFAALLTPQGKIIADFIVAEAAADDGGGFYLDLPRALAGTLVQKLNFYKLRAKVTVQDVSDSLGVMAAWDGPFRETESGLCYPDPRLPELGLRAILPPANVAEAAADLGATLADEEEYDAHRIARGVPRGGRDFMYGDAFPHETDMDQLAGVDFDKGCFIGQEVVSRMEHRSTARTRVIPFAVDGPAPDDGARIIAGERSIGTIGSAANGHALASVRLDRLADALAQGHTITAGGITVRAVKPAWARFAFPGDEATP
jgi:folate-binding protein YgfZ